MAAISVSKRACMARTATPVVMEMSRRFMGRLSLTRGAGSEARVASSAPVRFERRTEAGITPGLYAVRLGGGTMSAVTFRA